MADKLNELVETFNEYTDEEMRVHHNGDEWFTLYIGMVEVTQGDEFDIINRVKQINRENGYDWL